MASVAPPSPTNEPDRPFAMKESWLDEMEKAENRLQDNVSTVRNEIKAFFHYCREKLDAREKELMTQLDDNCERIANYLTVQRTKLLATQSTSKTNLCLMSSEAELISPSLKNYVENRDSDLQINNKDDMICDSEKICNANCLGGGSVTDSANSLPHRKKHHLNKIKHSPDINLSQADGTSRKQFNQMVNRLGLVYAGKADPSKTVACCRPALVNARCTGKVKAVDKFGNECNKGKDDVCALLEAPSSNITKCNITDCRNGTYNVAFVPTELGKHKLHIKVSGVPLTSGPLELYARFVRVHVKSAFLGGSCLFSLEIPSDYELNWKSEDHKNECAATLTPQMLGITVLDPDTKVTKCSIVGCTEKKLGVARYNVRFFPLKPGDHEISVSLQDGPLLLQQIVPVQEREQIGSRGSAAGQLFSPTDIVVFQQTGEIFVADTVENVRIQKFATNGEFLAQYPVATQEPSIIAVDSQHIVALFQGCMEVVLYSHDGKNVGSFTAKNLVQPTDIAITMTGSIVLIDRKLCQLFFYSKTGKLELQVGKAGTKPGELKEPYYLCISAENHIFISEHGNHRIQEINDKGSYVKDLRSKEKMSEPGAIAITAGGHLLVYDEKDKKVQIVNLDENRFGGSLKIELLEPRTARIAATPDGYLVVLDMINNCLWRYRIPFEY